MSQFHFRLESVLRMRQETRDSCRQELARAVQAGQILADRRQEVADEHRQLVEQLRGAQEAGEVPVDHVLDMRRYEIILKLQSTEVAQQIQQIDQEVERRRQVLAQADQEVRALEKLKETQFRQWQLDQQRREQQQLDEVAGQLHRRKASQEVES